MGTESIAFTIEAGSAPACFGNTMPHLVLDMLWLGPAICIAHYPVCKERPDSCPAEVTILTRFLGAGKTILQAPVTESDSITCTVTCLGHGQTRFREWQEQKEKKIAIIENELEAKLIKRCSSGFCRSHRGIYVPSSRFGEVPIGGALPNKDWKPMLSLADGFNMFQIYFIIGGSQNGIP